MFGGKSKLNEIIDLLADGMTVTRNTLTEEGGLWEGARVADDLATAFAELKKSHRTSIENLDEVNMTFIGLTMLFSVLAQELETRVEEGEFPDLLNSIRERSEVLATAARNKLLARYSGGIA